MTNWMYVRICVINEKNKSSIKRRHFVWKIGLCVRVIFECPLFCSVTKKSFVNITSYKYWQ